jgi:glycosyltransferase involved in cell wall biosynthesis
LVKVSIVTINLNNRAGLEATLHSVACQTFGNIEHIVVDGASSDGSSLLPALGASHVRLLSEKDNGIYEAMNKGIRMCSGDYILFLNSGDLLAEPDTIQRVAGHLSRKTDIVYGNLLINEGDGLREGYQPGRIGRAHLLKDTLWHPTAFIRRELFDKLGLYDTTFRICGDYEFFFRAIVARNVSQLHVPVFISVFDLRGLSSNVANHETIREEKRMIRQKYLSPVTLGAYRLRSALSRVANRFRKWFR